MTYSSKRLVASRSWSYRLVSWKRRNNQDLATDDPSFRRLASVGQGHPGIPGSLRFRLRCVRKRKSRSGDRKKPPSVVAGFAIDRHCILREHRGSVKKGPVMLATIETVTKADRYGRPDATIRTFPHRQLPVNWSMAHVSSKITRAERLKRQHCHCKCPLRCSVKNVRIFNAMEGKWLGD